MQHLETGLPALFTITAAADGRHASVQVVISSAFESSIALAHYAHLAAALGTLHPTQHPRAPTADVDARTAALAAAGAALPPAMIDAVATMESSGGSSSDGIGLGFLPLSAARRTPPAAHGLGTGGWFAAEPFPLCLQRLPGHMAETLKHSPSHDAAAQVGAAEPAAACRGILLADAQRLWEVAAGNPLPSDRSLNRLASAPDSTSGADGQATTAGFWLGEELVPDPNPRVSSRKVATRAGSFTFRAVELGRLAAMPSPAYPSNKPTIETDPAYAHDWVPARPVRGADVGGSASRARVRVADQQPTVLLLHGFLGAAEDWAAVAGGLAGGPWKGPRALPPSGDRGGALGADGSTNVECGGWRCLALDLPGHGGSVVDSAHAGAHEPVSLVRVFAASGTASRAGL